MPWSITLFSAATLTVALLGMGEDEEARTLGEDTLNRCRQTVGPDNTYTLFAAGNLTYALVKLGKHEQAHTLGQDTLDRCHRMFGPEHVITRTLTQVLQPLKLPLLDAATHQQEPEDGMRQVSLG